MMFTDRESEEQKQKLMTFDPSTREPKAIEDHSYKFNEAETV